MVFVVYRLLFLFYLLFHDFYQDILDMNLKLLFHEIFIFLYFIYKFSLIYIIIFTKMLFKNLLEASNDIADNQLLQMEKQLKTKIQKAKSVATTCKVNKEADDVNFSTTSTGELIFPQFKADINYNQQFWKTYLKNEISFAMIKELSEKTNSLQQQVKEIQGLQQQYLKFYKLKNRKKNRRLAVQIEKNYNCPYQKCYKIYGSDVSLNLHIKLKHNGGNKTDRQKLAQQICMAQQKGAQLPQMRLNLPPGYLQQFRQNFFNRKQNENENQGQQKQQRLIQNHQHQQLDGDESLRQSQKLNEIDE